VFKLDTAGTLLRIAGDSRPGYAGDGGSATQAELNNPEGLAVDTEGNIYVADSGNNRIRRIRADWTIETIAGTGGSGTFGDGGLATEALLNQPKAVVLDPTGNLFIADSRNGLVREVQWMGRCTQWPEEQRIQADRASDKRAIVLAETFGDRRRWDSVHRRQRRCDPERLEPMK
jgi:hypothetical protein